MTVYDPVSMTCGCCHGYGFPSVALATRRGPGRTPAPAARGRHAAGAAREATAAPGVRGYSPPPPPVSPIRGLIDFHTHAAPDVFGRAVDDDELAAQAAARQMEAVVFKSHVTLTADRAWLARKHVPVGLLVGPEAPLEWMRHSPRVPLADTAARIRSVGAQHFVLGTDLGQTGNPTPADGLQMFVAGLQAEGISREHFETMGREVPGALLMG
jgi:hypothetical protein